MLYEYAIIMRALSCNSCAGDDEMEYLFVIKAVGDGQEDDEDWAGKMNETKRVIIAVEANLKKEFNAKMDSVNSNIASNNSKMDTINANISSNNASINDIKTTVNAIMKKLSE